MRHTVTRRTFLTRSAAAGAFGLAAGGSAVRAAASPVAAAADEDSRVAPQYRGFLRKSIQELPTPAMLVDLDLLEKNIQTLASYLKGRPVAFRAHAKTHKCLEVAKMQLAAGGQGLCGAKLGEADYLIRGGVKDVLITAPVVGPLKIGRLMELRGLTPDVKVVIDSEQNAMDLSAAALAAKRPLQVVIDVNVGQNRTGLGTPDQVVAMAQLIGKQKGLELVGLQGYHGNNQHTVGFENRRQRELQANERAVAARQALEKAGFGVQIVSVGGTGSYNVDADYPGVTEIQPGSYVYMDTHYSRIGGKGSEGDAYADFGNSMSILTTVISRTRRDTAVVDAGITALTMDERVPEAVGMTGAVYSSADEYGLLTLRNPSRDLKVGDMLQMTPGHCCTTVNLYDVCFGTRSGRVEHVWSIEGRGRAD
jgi:D-serine deaminase-like pyridoxal phosphate-dependent protein